MSELTFFLESGNLTYTIAITIVLMISVCEIIGLLAGTELISTIDDLFLSTIDALFPEIDFDVDVEIPTFAKLFDWLLVGRVPVLIIVLLFLKVKRS